jgi:hypothetical protein
MAFLAASEALAGIVEAVETAGAAIASFFSVAVEGGEALAEGLEGEEALEAGAEDSWRSRAADRIRQISERVRNNRLMRGWYWKMSFITVAREAINDYGEMFRMAHTFEKSALTKAEHSWKSVSDKVRHGHWFSSGHGHAMNGVTQGNYDFIVRRKRKHY